MLFFRKIYSYVRLEFGPWLVYWCTVLTPVPRHGGMDARWIQAADCRTNTSVNWKSTRKIHRDTFCLWTGKPDRRTSLWLVHDSDPFIAFLVRVLIQFTSAGEERTNTKYIHRTNTSNYKIESVKPCITLPRQYSYLGPSSRHPPVIRNKVRNCIVELELSKNKQLDQEIHDSSTWKNLFLNYWPN